MSKAGVGQRKSEEAVGAVVERKRVKRTEIGGIYKILCTDNGHFYFGRSKDFSKRCADHIKDMRSGRHKNPRLQNCFNKYGESSIEFSLIIALEDVTQQEEYEQKLINEFIDHPNCMNINRTAGVGCDVPWTEERKRKIGVAAKGRKMPPASDDLRKRRSLAMLGNRVSEETRLKISTSHKGKRLSEDHRKAISAMIAGSRNPMYGRLGALNPKSKPIYQLDINTSAFISEFSSAADIGRQLGYDPSVIGKVCKHKLKSAYGFKWVYKNALLGVIGKCPTVS